LPKVIWANLHTYAVKSPLVTMARPKFAPQKYPFPLTDPQTPLPASSKRSAVLPHCTGQTDRPTGTRTYDQTDRPRESLTPNNYISYTALRPQHWGTREEWLAYTKTATKLKKSTFRQRNCSRHLIRNCLHMYAVRKTEFCYISWRSYSYKLAKCCLYVSGC